MTEMAYRCFTVARTASYISRPQKFRGSCCGHTQNRGNCRRGGGPVDTVIIRVGLGVPTEAKALFIFGNIFFLMNSEEPKTSILLARSYGPRDVLACPMTTFEAQSRYGRIEERHSAIVVCASLRPSEPRTNQ